MTTASISSGRGRRRRLRWWLWLGLLLLAVVAAGGLGWYRRSAEAVPGLRTVTVAAGDIEKTVTALGSLQPKNYVDVGAQVSGQLKKVYVEIGDMVQKGQLLAEIDPTVYTSTVLADRAELSNLRAQLAQTQAELELAKVENTRNEALYSSDYISKSDLDTTRTAVKVDEAKIKALNAQIEKAESNLKGAEANLSYTKIYAPMSGTVASQTSLEGQTLNANQTAPVILRISDLVTMTVEAQVSEADVFRIKQDMPAYFTILGLSDRRWHGQVRQVKPTPETVNDVVLYNVLIDVGNTDGVLMTDMTAQVFFVLGEVHGVPLLPLTAVGGPKSGNVQPQVGSTVQVRVLGANGPERRSVTLGLVDRAVAEVASGLAVGDTLVLPDGTGGQAGGGQQSGGSNSGRHGPPGMGGPQL